MRRLRGLCIEYGIHALRLQNNIDHLLARHRDISLCEFLAVLLTETLHQL
jgi:hypothetical protein